MTDEATRHQAETLEWTAHPLREQPVRAVIASVVILACGWMVSLAVPNVLGGVLAGGGAMLFLFFMLNRFYLPSRYQMDANGIGAGVEQFEKVFEDMDVKTAEMDAAMENMYGASIDSGQVDNLL